MAHSTITFRLQDDDDDTQYAPLPLNVVTGLTLAQYQAYADVFTPLIDAVTGSKIAGIDLSLALSIAGTPKSAPVALAQNERGGLITFSTAIPKKFGVRIPAMLHSIMGGSSFTLEGGAVGSLVTALTTAQTAANMRALADFEENLVAALSGKRSQYKR
jgi:hypothetical protein